MTDTQEIIFTMAAMVLFSTILLSANRMILRNDTMVVEGELEYEVIALANNIIEESRVTAFDEETVTGFVPINIPTDFTAIGVDVGETTSDRSTFDDFDDYDGWSGTITTEQGDYTVSSEVTYLNSSTLQPTTSKSTLKQITVTITNEFLTRNTANGETEKEYAFQFIRSYYAD
ncbi:hypothetical protein AB2B38_012705 [Balneola sp. MJW-20]|uniref:hypothetical protein n=1 Tax=Gracilimonas aurantiaca TaxID=3234185 RepID=UPI0034653E06